MSTKRVRIREMKRKQAQRRKMYMAAGVAVVLLIAAGITLFQLDKYSRSYILTFEGQKVGIDEFKLYEAFSTSEEDVKADALSQLLTYLVVSKTAKADGFTLTDEERQDELDMAVSLKSYYTSSGIDMSFVSDELLAEHLGSYTLYDRLLEKYTADYVVDENDFQQAYNDYKQNNRVDYYDMQMKHFVVDSAEEREAAIQDLETMSFDEVEKKYTGAEDPEDGTPYVAQTYVIGTMASYYQFDEATIERMLALQPGEMSEVVDLGNDMSALFYVESLYIPTEDELNASFRERYLSEKKNAMFDEIINGWKEEANFTVNQKAYDAA